ncbi:hypothetical protein EDC44_10462 [Cricetibacter osteomyelitidis]|uniref:Uncharacterized protein n=1 Tax=Cricetibacter osteomyelitidis TaxID=1521931 RepID=A0A4R2T0Y4_9PAST|nr:hypothetical protein [Cricetibacter osteomyelitidis]TCP96529.1 hypothetical protein EDC44_10462 [Cricetibacter osteomyelitidis]
MYKISEEAKKGMHATPEQLGEKLTGLPEDITRCSRDCPFNVSIRLKKSTLTPLALSAFNIEAWETWWNDDNDKAPYQPIEGEKGEEKIKIEITVQQRSVERLYVEMLTISADTPKSGKVLKRWQLSKSGDRHLSEGSGAVDIGIYEWEWDGYIDDKLDTKLLKDETTYIRAVGTIGKAFRDDAVQILAQPFKECAEPVDWVDVVVDRKAHKVDVEWRVKFDDGHISDKPRSSDIPSYRQLIDWAIDGIKYHWNRSENILINNIDYKVIINPKEAETKSAPSLTLQVETWYLFSPSRSVNASCVCGIIGGIAGNIGNGNAGFLGLDATKVWYLQKYFQQLYISSPARAESAARDNFKMTAAHEAGHPVLASYAYQSTGLNNYSWVHKGSSKGIGSFYSLPDDGEKGYEEEPLIEADLMKYYNQNKYSVAIPYKMYSASEHDIKSLVWLSRLTFGE